MDSLAFLERAGKVALLPLYVVHGDDAFLKRQVLLKLRALVLGPDDDGFALSVYPGDKTQYAAVMDELGTASFFGPRRLVQIDDADPFVSEYRGLLEKAVGKLAGANVLILEVKSWPATTRLAKLVSADATIACKAPPSAKLPAWCVQWAKAQHGKQLIASAGQLLVDLIGAEMGQLAQELEKLAVYVGDRTRIADEDVDKLVGRSQVQEIWKIFDAIGAGDSKAALTILQALLEKGEEPLKIVGALSMSLRRLAQVNRLVLQGQTVQSALDAAGVNPFFARGVAQQLKHLGPQRAGQLYERLLALNLDLRGASPLPATTVLERFVIELARRAL